MRAGLARSIASARRGRRAPPACIVSYVRRALGPWGAGARRGTGCRPIPSCGIYEALVADRYPAAGFTVGGVDRAPHYTCSRGSHSLDPAPPARVSAPWPAYSVRHCFLLPPYQSREL